MIAIALAATLFAAPQVGQDYFKCLLSVAKALEPSGESAEPIAQAAVTACGVLEPNLDAKRPLPIDAHLAAMEEFRVSVRHFLALHLIRERACRRTPGCAQAGLPPPFRSELSN